MSTFQVPVRVNVPALGTLEVEADSLENACLKVQADIDTNGFDSLAADAEFTTNWGEQSGLTVDDVLLPSGQLFSSPPRD